MNNLNSSISSLYTKPIEEINYQDILSFIEEQHSENIDLDYKSDWPNDLDALMCAFANSQGGLILIGVNEEDKKPTFPVIGIGGAPEKNEQKVLHIAMDSIHPFIFPEIKAIRTDQIPESIVVLIRIEPSRYMHAVKRKKIYIRVGDSKKGFENDLASVEFIEWLWSQKKQAYEFNQSILEKITERANNERFIFKRKEDFDFWNSSSFIEIMLVSPVPLINPISPYDLKHRLVEMGQVAADFYDWDRCIPPQKDYWRTLINGVCVRSRGFNHAMQYVEIVNNGIIYGKFVLNDNEEAIDPRVIIVTASLFLDFVSQVIDIMGWRGAWNLTFRLGNVRDHWLNLFPNSGRDYSEHINPENEILLLEMEENISSYSQIADKIVSEVTTKLFWAFGIPIEKDKTVEWLNNNLKKRPI